MEKSAWIYITIIVAILAIVALGVISLSNRNSPTGAVTSNSQNTKQHYPYTLSGINQNDYLDKPNSLVSIDFSGINNTLKVSSETEVSSITFSGENNKILFCSGGFPIPTNIDKSGIDNQIVTLNC